MKCVFCSNETNTEKRWHIDCIETAIEEEFGIDVYNILLEQSAMTQSKSVPIYLERLISEGVDEGKRNITRFKIFAWLNMIGFDVDFVSKKIEEFNNNCRPPESANEVSYQLKYLARRFYG